MKIYEYIKIMKDNKPTNLDLNNIWEQFYEVNEQVLSVLYKNRSISKSQYDKLWLVNENIAGEIILSWLGDNKIILCRETPEIVYYDVLKCYEPKTNEKHWLVGNFNRTEYDKKSNKITE